MTSESARPEMRLDGRHNTSGFGVSLRCLRRSVKIQGVESKVLYFGIKFLHRPLEWSYPKPHQVSKASSL